jgi:ATP-dependent HslUV protease ATP-binding subunit HslU
MYRILTEPVTNILRQQAELLSTEQVKLEFTEEAKREIARVASLANKTIENIGARRLHTVLERIVEELSFDASDKEPGTTITVDKEYVEVRPAAPTVSLLCTCDHADHRASVRLVVLHRDA